MTPIETAEHLKSLLTTEEQREFMDTILNEMVSYEMDIDNLKDENKELESDKDKLEDELEELENRRDYADKIDAGIGYIDYTTENIDLSEPMDTLAEKLDTNSATRITEYLSFLR